MSIPMTQNRLDSATSDFANRIQKHIPSATDITVTAKYYSEDDDNTGIEFAVDFHTSSPIDALFIDWDDLLPYLTEQAASDEYGVSDYVFSAYSGDIMIQAA